MDYLLVLLAITGVVVAGVMLLLASRATRMQRESDARVDELQSLATGAVLFAAASPEELEFAPISANAADDAMSSPFGADAFDDFRDEATESRREVVADVPAAAAPAVSFDLPAHAHPFVMTVSGAGRIVGSFDRTPHRSRT